MRKKKPKHVFTPLNLTVSKRYLVPASKQKMIWAGCVLALGFLIYFLLDSILGTSSFIASGPISSNHVNFETNCSACHELGHSVSATLCSSCHEKTSEFNVYDFKAHYLYRSNDPERLSADNIQKYRDREKACSSCHLEHQGREADLKQVANSKCIDCHAFDSFNTRHPEFEFARTKIRDDSTLRMTHLRHTVFVLQEMEGLESPDVLFQTVKAKTMDFEHFFEAACLYCHNPQPDGRNFEAINFDQHCTKCHVQTDALVQGLPLFNPANPNSAGVETIAQIQARGGPGVSWTFAMNPNLINREGGEVAKNFISHKDPWIMENLKQIRRKLYPGNEFSELPEISGKASKQNEREYYAEVIQTLESYAEELKNRAELKQELIKIKSWLKVARDKLKKPALPSGSLPGRLTSSKSNAGLTPSQKSDFLQLASDLTSEDGPECQKCHVLQNAMIAGVQSDQKVLSRAEFNHRAHVLEKRCTECHTAIPIEEKLLRFSVENYSEFKQTFANVFKADRAVTPNIPKLSTCQTCHAPKKVANDCITCHRFHANKENRANLQLFPQRVQHDG